MLNSNLLRVLRWRNSKIIGVASLCKRTDKFSSESSSSSSDEEIPRRNDLQKRSQLAREKLNLLLEQMVQEETFINKETSLEFAKAQVHKKPVMKKERGVKSVQMESIDVGIVKAVQEVAETIGGDVKQTESELLQKLLHPINQDVSSNLSLTELVKDMQIDRDNKKVETSRADQVRQLLKIRQTHIPISQTTRKKQKPRVQSKAASVEDQVILYIKERLQIFNPEEVSTWQKPSVNKIWDALHKRELELSVTHPPPNYFQQMILWTNQGKLWKFPIDNEQDLDDEKEVYFTEHIFLEKYLKEWCPSKGPIRHFMELVCVGLSKNPYLTVEMKREHIEWFKNYFNEKKQLLTEVGAFPPGFDIDVAIANTSEIDK